MAGLLGGLSAAIVPRAGYLTLLCVQRHLVLPAPLRYACDGFLHGRLGGQLARMAAE